MIPQRAPHDPPYIPQRAGLGPSECVRCGAATLGAPGYDRPVCDPCRHAAVEMSAAQPSIFPVARAGSELDVSHRASIDRHVRREAPASTPVKIKILEPAIEVEDWRAVDRERVPLAARRLAILAEEYGRRVKVTYALAHDLAKDVDIHSLCVRLWTDAGERFGYASYVNGQSSSCVLWRGEEGGPRTCGVSEFATLALGQPWTPPTPPPVGPCPRCQRSVRWTSAGAPYGHNRPETKDRCPGLQSS